MEHYTNVKTKIKEECLMAWKDMHPQMSTAEHNNIDNEPTFTFKKNIQNKSVIGCDRHLIFFFCLFVFFFLAAPRGLLDLSSTIRD